MTLEVAEIIPDPNMRLCRLRTGCAGSALAPWEGGRRVYSPYDRLYGGASPYQSPMSTPLANPSRPSVKFAMARPSRSVISDTNFASEKVENGG